jgi:hypothetical protein
MTVYIGSQAKEIFLNDRFHINSMGIFKTNYGWAYWFWSDFIFDSGVAETEEKAFEIAKKNLR